MANVAPLVLGAVLTLAGGLIAAWVQSRREHKRWVRERRYEAYVELVKLHGLLDSARVAQRAVSRASGPVNTSFVDDFHAELTRRLPEAIAAAEILGPRDVAEATTEVLRALDQGTDDEIIAAHTALAATMRRVLKVGGSR